MPVTKTHWTAWQAVQRVQCLFMAHLSNQSQMFCSIIGWQLTNYMIMELLSRDWQELCQEKKEHHYDWNNAPDAPDQGGQSSPAASRRSVQTSWYLPNFLIAREHNKHENSKAQPPSTSSSHWLRIVLCCTIVFKHFQHHHRYIQSHNISLDH